MVDKRLDQTQVRRQGLVAITFEQQYRLAVLSKKLGHKEPRDTIEYLLDIGERYEWPAEDAT